MKNLKDIIPANDQYYWDVPEYKILFKSAKSNQACIVIPIINEGKRIKHLLQRMMECETVASRHNNC